MNCIDARKLCFSYPGNIDVFRNLDFSIACGEKAGIVGPNGSGKSTLFLLLTGLLAPSSGRLCLWGKNMNTADDFRQARSRTGYLFQDPEDQLFCPTVEEDIAFALLNRGIPRQQALEKVEEWCDLLKIGHLRKRVPFHLSWGQKKLVALAGVLVTEPELLLLDEPTDGIDSTAAGLITTQLRQFPSTLLLATHDRKLLDSVCRHTFRLTGSHLEQS